jgi:tetratricopeptide (TPR) repeat protein
MVTFRNFPTLLLLTALAVPATSVSFIHVRAQEASPDSVDTKALIRDAYLKTKTATTLADFTKVIELCEKTQADTLSPALATYVRELLAWAHNRRGEMYAEQGASLTNSGDEQEATKIDAMAMTEFATAVGLQPDYWKAIHNRGVSYALEGKFPEAIKDFTRTLELKPEYASAWFNRGELHFELGKYTEALTDYTQAIRLKPDDHDAYVRRGHANFQLRRYREALTDYSRAFELNRQSAETLIDRGDAHLALRQWREAAIDYREAIALDADSGRAYQSAAWLMATCPDDRYRNNGLALQAAQKAIELDGRADFKYLDTLAAAYARAGEFNKAKQAAAEALKIAPKPHVDPIRRRLALYQQNQPYRQAEQIAERSDSGAVR